MEVFVISVVLIATVVVGVSVQNTYRMRSLLKTTRQMMHKANRRSNHWKHYAHVLELRAFHGESEHTRDAFRSKYIHDFTGWGGREDERTDVL